MTTIPSIAPSVRLDETDNLATPAPTRERADHFRDLLDHARSRHDRDDDTTDAATARRTPNRPTRPNEASRENRRGRDSEPLHAHHHAAVAHHAPKPVERPDTDRHEVGTDQGNASAEETSATIAVRDGDVSGTTVLGDVPAHDVSTDAVLPASTDTVIDLSGGQETGTAADDATTGTATTSDATAVAATVATETTEPMQSASSGQAGSDGSEVAGAEGSATTAVPSPTVVPGDESARTGASTATSSFARSALATAAGRRPAPSAADDATNAIDDTDGTAAATSTGPATPGVVEHRPTHTAAPTDTNAATSTAAAVATVAAATTTSTGTGTGTGSGESGRSATPAAPIAALGAAHQPTEVRTNFAAAVATATPTAPARPADPAEQVLGALLPLHNRPDGTYTMQLELHPHDLGRVQLTVELHKGVLSVHMQADRPEARAALAAHLDHLRDLLDAQGVQTGRLDLANNGGSNLADAFRAGADARNGDGTRNTRGTRSTASAETDTVERTERADSPATRPATGDRRLDLQI